MVQFFDEERVVQRPEISLPAGAIRGWDRRNAYYFQLINALARHYEFDIDTPFCELPESLRTIILHGSGKTEIVFTYFKSGGRAYKRKHPFEGVMTNMERRYRETDSNMVREDLAR